MLPTLCLATTLPLTRALAYDETTYQQEMPFPLIKVTTVVVEAVLTVATSYQQLDMPAGDVPWVNPQQHAVIGLISSFS